MIKFITTDPNQGLLTFDMVVEDQFFVDIDGRLCQKYDCSTANVICLANGDPYAGRTDFDEEELIKKILPHVVKIEF